MEKSEWLSSTSVRKECLPRKFVKTSWKPLGRSLFLIAHKKWTPEFKRGRDSIWDDPKDATTDENVKLLHTLVMCDKKRDLRSKHKFWGSTINPNGHLRYAKGFGKMGSSNVERRSEKDTAQYF